MGPLSSPHALVLTSIPPSIRLSCLDGLGRPAGVPEMLLKVLRVESSAPPEHHRPCPLHPPHLPVLVAGLSPVGVDVPSVKARHFLLTSFPIRVP